VISDRAADQLITVAGQIILVSQHLQRIALKRFHSALRHRKRVVLKIDPPGFFVTLVNREIDDPGKGKPILIGQPKCITNLNPCLAGHTLERARLAAKEERRIADFQPQLDADGFGALGANVLGQRSGGFFAQHDFTSFDLGVHFLDRNALFLSD